MKYLENIPIIGGIDFQKYYIRMNEMDFEGQKQSEKDYKRIILLFLIIGSILGYATQSMSKGVYTILLGTLIAIIITIPSWPRYNRNHLKWLPHNPENKVY